jgi:hypothetical protein
MPKFYDKRTLNHEQAVAWAKQQILQMRFAFNETHTEAGIDAFVELADPQTGAAAACFLGVQVKTQEQFAAESAEQFSFYADGDDLNYWNSSQIPVLLLVCKARTSEAYGIFVQDYFNIAENRTKKTIIFNKQNHRFESGDIWQRRLLDSAVPRSRGLSFPPNPAPEELSSNLLEVILPQTVFTGRSSFKHRREVIGELRKADSYASEFIIRDGSVWSLHSLYDTVWNSIIENPTIKRTAFLELAFHQEPSKRDYARELLTLCLTARLRQEEIHWFRDEEMFIYYPNREQAQRVRKSVRNKRGETKIGLLHVTERGGRTIRCRHAAMMAKFVDIGDKYFLQIDPTWCFTRDGYKKHPRWEDLIRRIRIMQKERDYHSALRLWREILTPGGDLMRQNYPFLNFGDYLHFESPVSVADNLWKSTSDLEPEVNIDQSLLEFDK